MRYILSLLILTSFYSCTSVKNFDKPALLEKSDGYFFEVRDGNQLFIYDYKPIENYNSAIFIISGITGINHNSETDIIELLSNNENRIVVVHPRGTGYSDGTRGDISNFNDFINDYSEIIRNDRDYGSNQHKVFLFGHSMSTSVLLAAADSLHNIAGAILVNPPYMRKEAKGMSPSFSQYIEYASYYLFANHTPIVNMAGDPAKIENEEARKESELRINDPLLVKYFSMYMMSESKKIMDSMIDYSKTADYPLLLIYGEKDNVVDRTGCDLIYENWKCENKEYRLMKNGTHGKSTVIQANEIIKKWINKK
ncbi:MAG: alpha/beta fold hydrolase [Bacteroidota bacterium]|nr:alpha/beta fold hydrolase [Bacteroidota bacterium]